MLWFCFCALFLEIAFVSGHEVAKREATGGKSYVLYERGTCVNVTSENPCHVSEKIPAETAWKYEYTNWFVKFVALKDISNRQCKDALGAFYCTRSIPKCAGNEDVDLQAVCKSAKIKCQNINNEPKTCKNIMTVKVNQTMKCVTVEKGAIQMCPEIKHKMLQVDLEDKKEWAKYFETFTMFVDPSYKLLFSSECRNNLKRAGCAARYCSDDEKRILVDYTREDCTSDIACAVNRIKSLPVDDPNNIKKVMQVYLDKNAAYCLLFPKASKVTSGGSAGAAWLQFSVFFASLMFVISYH